jgi:hypothetical protein
MVGIAFQSGLGAEIENVFYFFVFVWLSAVEWSDTGIAFPVCGGFSWLCVQ